jgi:hypothetical protein
VEANQKDKAILLRVSLKRKMMQEHQQEIPHIVVEEVPPPEIDLAMTETDAVLGDATSVSPIKKKKRTTKPKKTAQQAQVDVSAVANLEPNISASQALEKEEPEVSNVVGTKRKKKETIPTEGIRKSSRRKA